MARFLFIFSTGSLARPVPASDSERGLIPNCCSPKRPCFPRETKTDQKATRRVLARLFRPPIWDGPIVCVTLTTDDSITSVSRRETVLQSFASVVPAAMFSRHCLQHDPSVRNHPL